MYTIQPKKMLIINILDILKKYTDAEHRLSQADIVKILEKEYSMKVDRKAVKRNLMNLIDFGYNIEYSESNRIGKDGGEEALYTDWYIERDFSDSELRLLIDSLLFSKHIPHSQCRALIKKLEGLSNIYFRAKVNHVCNLPEDNLKNKQLFYTIEVLDEAISQKKRVSFSYNYYDVDKKLHPKRDGDGKVRLYVINPYQIVATNGRYYLICNNDKFDNVANYRLDRITDIVMLDSPVKPAEKVKGLEKGLNLPRHMAEHIYMFSGDCVKVTFRAKRYIVNEIFDWFGSNVHFSEVTDEEVTVSVDVNIQAMLFWAMQYSEYITVISPLSLAERLKANFLNGAEKYSAVVAELKG